MKLEDLRKEFDVALEAREKEIKSAKVDLEREQLRHDERVAAAHRALYAEQHRLLKLKEDLGL